jgi:maleamate amidohydrolase
VEEFTELKWISLDGPMDLDRKSLPFGRRPALILVDLMLGFTDPACPLGSESRTVIEANLALLEVMRARDFPIFFTRVIYDADSQAPAFRARVPALNLLIHALGTAKPRV